MIQPVLILVGPTGSGKTELSLVLAKRLGCEIISADSMQIYKGMDIGTAKPTASQRKKVRHHLVDLILPKKSFSVYQHRRLALGAIKDILQRGRIPLVVGGGGLYVAALWRGISPQLGEDKRLRRKLDQIARKKTPELYLKLEEIDPIRAQKIHSHDRRRIVRALEIALLSGKTPTEWYQEKQSLEDLGYSVRIFGIARDRTELYEWINQRVETMFRRGFISEVKRLRKIGFSKTARQALGYREILGYLKKGRRNGLSDLIRLIQTRTRRFAKRQLTWLRREKEICWVEWEKGESAQKACDRIRMEIDG